ncbi:MerR family transcriptional regulator [Actinocatenispora sera]|uniref:MerR family transcriptional regulator n=1 Tax=Actinocatenispora sera TaxID=390989 RepID=A0A810KTK7_9ACTN|nr:MerR family transcriptional regulator [Actinocatenispora sera]BCJ26563.1 MerR family transcriptional regulator [Actinocatenispora sera]
MTSGAHLAIGDLARLTGLSVKTVRFYSDLGLVPPAGRTAAGQRRYDAAAVTRLRLVRTLRALGLDLATVARILGGQTSLAEVAAVRVAAVTEQLHALRRQRAVLAAVAEHGIDPKETDLMSLLSDDDRVALIDDFLGTVFAGLDLDGVPRSLTPELPDDPDAAQAAAWLELTALLADDGFRAVLRRTAEQFHADRVAQDAVAGGRLPRPDAVALAIEQARPALAARVDPGSPAAASLVAALTERYAATLGHPAGLDVRTRLAARLETAADPRRQRYLELLSVVNGWPALPAQTEPIAWSRAALSAS